jgi:hypothetical protein
MTRWVWVIAFLCVGGALAQEHKQPQGQGQTSMELELKIDKPQFMVQESLRVEVTMSNGSSAAVIVPEIADARNRALSYQLTGPSFPKGFSFQYARDPEKRMSGDPAMRTIGPGAKLSVPIAIEKYWSGWKPGSHTLRAVLSLGVEKIESNVLHFEILQPKVKSAEVLADSEVSVSQPVRAVLLASAGGASHVYQVFLTEPNPSLEKNPETNFSQLFEVPEGATAVAALWADFNRAGEMVSPRYVWLNGQTAAVQEFQSPPITFDLGKDAVVRPGIMTRDGVALLVTWSGAHVNLTRIPRKGTASKAWELTLPLPASAGRAWITSDGKITAVFVAEHSSRVCMFLVQDGKVIANTEVQDSALLPRSEPALSISPDGTIRSTVLVADPKRQRSISTVEWKWKPGEGEVAPKRETAVDLAQDAKAAEVIYSFSPGEPRRDWVILCGSNILVTGRSPRRPRVLKGTPVLPLQLVPRTEMSYLLVEDPKQILYLDPVF